MNEGLKKNMNEYKQLKNMNDSRWTNLLKCDIIKNLTELEEFEKHARYTAIAATRQKEKQNLQNLKKFKEKYDSLMKETNSYFINNVSNFSSNQRLSKRYGSKYLHPYEIKSSIRRSIYKITNETNKLFLEVHKKEKMINDFYSEELHEQNTLNYNLKQIRTMGKIADIEKKIVLVDSLNKKTKKILESEKHNLRQYDLIYEQLTNDLESTSESLAREIEIVDSIKADIKNDDRKYKAGKEANEIFIKKAKHKITKFKSMTDSLEQCRNLLMKSKEMTEIEKEFHASLPWTLDYYDSFDKVTIDSSDSKLKLIEEKKTWYGNLLEFGLDNFIDKEKSSKIMSDLKNNAASSSIDYKFPENIAEYVVTMNNNSNTIDELALSYVLKNTKFNTAEDLLKSIVDTKNDLIKLDNYNALRSTRWKSIIEIYAYARENAEKLNLITSEDSEYSEKIDVLKLFLDEQKLKLSGIEATKTHYIKLLNDLYFYMQNIQKIYDRIYLGDGDTKRNANTKITSPAEPKGTIDNCLMTFVEELKSMVNDIVRKIRLCASKTDHVDFSPAQLKLGYALYVYNNQKCIQENILKQKMKPDNILKKISSGENTKISDEIVLTRQDIKRQADQIVKHFKEKDLDASKNKRRPISFRKRFI